MASSENSDRPVVSRKLLQYLSGELTEEWQDVARNLSITEGELHKIKSDNVGHDKEKIHQMLIYWQRKKGPLATHSILAEALKNAERRDLSDKVQDEAVKPRKRSLENEPSFEYAASSSKRRQATEELSVNRSAVGDGDMTADMKDKKTQFVRELKYKYTNLCSGIQPVPFRSEKYDIDKLFVESGIAVVEKQEGFKKQEKLTPLKNHKAIFTDPRVKSKRRIIDGEPGCGKSTLALQITHDWIHETAPMNDIEILILLRLRQFKNVPTVCSAIKKFLLPRDSTLTEDDIKIILDSSSTLILLDGYNEYPDQKNREGVIALIIRGDMLQEHDVVLITRTSCMPEDYSHGTKRIRLTGFDDVAKMLYIQNVVAADCPEEADKIHQFLSTDPVPADLCRIPLFFSMISHMVYLDRFYNLQTVTELFKHIIKCFHSHDQLKGVERNQVEKLDHSTLDKIAFDGLSGDTQQISWNKTVLRSKIGEKPYNQYVRIGILLEEESYDYDAMDYNTETRFVHNMFVEWYAAHYLEKFAEQPEATFEPWHEEPRRRTLDTSQWHQPANTDKVHSLKSLNPDDVHYMYRYACGLNPEAAPKIIKHLAKNESYDKYTLLCIAEWRGSLETVMDPVILLCSRKIQFGDTDSLLLQKSTAALVKFASTQKIPMCYVELHNCLDVGDNGNLRVKSSSLHLPVIDTTLHGLVIYETGREITEEETDSILQYAAKCLGLKKLLFYGCLFPRYIKVTEPMSVLGQRGVLVEWGLGFGLYLLNLESGQWEHRGRRRPMADEQKKDYVKPMTDEDYQRAVEEIRMLTEDITRKDVPRFHLPDYRSYKKGNVDSYKRLKNDVSFMLQKEDCTKLASFFQLSSGQMDTIRSSKQSANKFLFVLEEKGILHPSNVSELEKAFSTLNINAPCYNKIVSYQKLITVERTDSLETSAVVSNRRCVLTIAGTGVELHIPPNAFQDHEEERIVTMRIIPYHLLDEPSRCFEDHSTAVVEILPNKSKLPSAAKLVLPHCLKIRNPRDCDVQVFHSHHEPGEKPKWRNISESVSVALFHNFCEISLKNFCWVKYIVTGKGVTGKELIVYATGDYCQGSDYAIVDVGFYPNIKGADERYRENKGEHKVTQNFMFLKEPELDLDIQLTRIIPDTWEPEPTHSAIKYDAVKLLVEKRRSFLLRRKGLESTNYNAPLKLCRFEVSKGEEWVELMLQLQKPKTLNAPSTPSPGLMNERVPDKVLWKLSPKLGKHWKRIGRWLDLKPSEISHICTNNAGDEEEMAHDMLLKWNQKHFQNATYKILEEAFRNASRGDLADELKVLQVVVETC